MAPQHAPPEPHRPAFDPAAPDAATRLDGAREVIGAVPRRRDQMLPALLAAQHALGWLPAAAITLVAEHIRVPLSEVYASATGYSELRLERPVPGTWYVCRGVSCDLAGAEALMDALAGALDGPVARTDCQFLCALAPVAVDDAERMHGRVTADRVLARTRPAGGAS